MNMAFFNGAVGAIQQQQRMNVQANNISNVNNYGFKAERATFHHLMYGNVTGIDEERLPKGAGTKMAKASIDFSNDGYLETGRLFDFAIEMADGSIAYTRAGSFTLDADGCLCLSELGFVLDREGNHIQLPTDYIKADDQGNLYDMSDGYLGTLGIFQFEDNGALERNAYGLFTGENAEVNEEAEVLHKWVERSNVDMVREMVSMMSTQRALQSAAQMSKIYDEVIQRAVNDIGRLA